MLNEDNLISTLEQSLRQFQVAEQRLQERLRKIEDEATDLKVEIEALQNSAEKTEEALESLFSTMRSGTKSWKTHRKAVHEDEIEVPKKSRYEDENDYQKNQPRYDENDYPKKSRYDNGDDYETPRRYSRPNVNNQPPPDNYRKNPVAYMNNSKNVAPINRNFETKNNRFAERTITQACTLLLREAPQPLHVNELFHLLVEGGFNFTGNNPTISIAVSLNRNRRFRKVAPGTFDLVMRDASQAAS
jgi:chromosome segregation ATPase